MRKNLILILLLLVNTFAFAQTKVSNELLPFEKVEVDGNIELTLVKGGENSFEAELIGVDQTQFQWEIVNGKVVFKLKNPINIGKDKDIIRKVNIELTYNGDLSEITTMAKAMVQAKSDVNTNSISLELSGKSIINLDINAKDIEINSVGSIATISGKTEFLTIKSSSSASVNCAELNSKVANVITSLNAECYVWATEKLDAKANSKSNLFYKGEPEFKNVTSSTFGNVQKF